ncbi:hypothetical protein ACH5RR_033984 [Cinchona calisaya]|uniref:Antifreeze protein n=1 Tax=Cinchona calisaya TaxID=153742 RepID=A0ABD2YAX6_9GENT
MQCLAAAGLGKNYTATTHVERLDSATECTATPAMGITKTSNIVATISPKENTVATATQFHTTTTRNVVITSLYSSISTSKRNDIAVAAEACSPMRGKNSTAKGLEVNMIVGLPVQNTCKRGMRIHGKKKYVPNVVKFIHLT